MNKKDKCKPIPKPPYPHRPPDGYYDMYEPPLGHKPPFKPHNHCAGFTPHLLNYHLPHNFKFWCNKVVPLVYDDSLSYMELLNKVVLYLNNLIDDEKMVAVNMEEIFRAFHDLEMFVNDYFSFYQSKGVINFDIAVTNDNYLEILPDCDTAQMNTIYRLKFVEGSTQTIPANLPQEAIPFSGAECILINLDNFILKHLGNEWEEIPPNGKQYSTKNNYQMLFTDSDIFFRENNGDTWEEWKSLFGNWWSTTWVTVKQYIDEADTNIMNSLNALIDSLGALAYKDCASGSYTPTGTVSQPTFTGENVTLTNTGVVHDTSVVVNTTSSSFISNISYNAQNTSLTFNDSDALTAITSAGLEDDSLEIDDIDYTPRGTVSQPTFTGVEATYTPTGTVSQPTFTGDEATITVE